MKDTLIQCFMYYTGAPSTWNGDLDALLYGVRITEEDFDRFYTEISKNLKTMKQNIKIVSTILKKINSLREDIIC